MNTTPFQRKWIEISEVLGLNIQLSFEIELGDRRLTVPVLLEGYGWDKGMLLVTDFDTIGDVYEELVDLGYGFSCLSEPSSVPIDWKSVEEMLRDWGRIS
jgi:hypothetical protein